MRLLRFAISLALAALPSALKVPIYRRLFGYRIGRGVRIGFSPFFEVGECRIGDHARIGPFNLFYRVSRLELGDHVRIGFLNVIRGGDEVVLGDYCTVLRLNTFNSIVEARFAHPVDSALRLGTGVFVASGHWLDFSAGIAVGDHSIIGGRNSSIWTHNRQLGRGVTVGCHSYLGSEIRVAPGAETPAFCIVALGSVVSGKIDRPFSLIGGNPATVIRELQDRDLFLLMSKTREDIPDEIAQSLIPEFLRESACRAGEATVSPDDEDLPRGPSFLTSRG